MWKLKKSTEGPKFSMYVQLKFNFFNSQDILPKFGVVISFSINNINIVENHKKVEKQPYFGQK